jgi:dGTPase
MEKDDLKPYAMTDAEGEMRDFEEPGQEDKRSAYKRDIDRITFSDYYRRLEGKAQVILAFLGDNFRKRLTHTSDVAKIAISIANNLGCNSDLSEAIAHAHDLGHTPFGHIGEKALNEKMEKFGLHFEHNEQSLRIVEKVEKSYPGFDGLNLTKAVREGMMKHKTSWDNRDVEFDHMPHLEAGITDAADEIAYTAHDIYDGLNAGLIPLVELKKQPLFMDAAKKVKATYGIINDKKRYVKRCISALIGYLVDDLCEESRRMIEEFNVNTPEDVRNAKEKLTKFTDETTQKLKKMREFLTEHFYANEEVRRELRKGERVISDLFDLYYENTGLMPEEFQQEIEKGERKEIVVKDYIAGMTDRYAYEKWSELNHT